VLDPPLASPRITFNRFVSRSRVAISAALALVLGAAPHVLHHAGPLAGAALFAGIGGSLLFGALGLVAAVPWLMRVQRRAGNWLVPGALLALFVTVFSLSTFVIGPAIAGGEESDAPVPARQSPPVDQGHEAHHD